MVMIIGRWSEGSLCFVVQVVVREREGELKVMRGGGLLGMECVCIVQCH